jgi:hypothetical protein
MPRPRKTPEEVRAARIKAARSKWDKLNFDARSSEAATRWQRYTPEERRRATERMRSFSPSHIKHHGGAASVAVEEVQSVTGGPTRDKGSDRLMPDAAAPSTRVTWGPSTADNSHVAEPLPAILQGRWYSRVASAHQDLDRANGRAWLCACGACRVARREAE